MSNKVASLEEDIKSIKGVIKEILRRLDNQDRYLELIYKDRELLNENREDMAGLKQRMVDHAEHIENVVAKEQHEITKKVVEASDFMEQKTDEIKEDVVKGITGALTKEKTLKERVLNK